MSGFSNAILGGAQKLIRAAIQSPNYIAGNTGWTINKDGSAEFNGIIVRGQFSGVNYTVNQNGSFYYAGTPAAGNLIASIATTGGTDAFNNYYLGGGFTAYN